MASISAVFLIFGIIAVIAMTGLLICFIVRFFVYGYVGNVYFYIVTAYLICLMMSLVINLNPIPVNTTEQVIVDDVLTTIKSTGNNVSYDNPMQAVGASLFEALRMMITSFDKSLVAPFFKQELAEIDNNVHKFFGFVYYISSGFALLTTSIGIILFFAKSFFAKLRNFFRSFLPHKEVYYIFSESKVASAARKLANVLKQQKHIVIMYVTKASLKTQDGTEYRDALINDGLDVKSEAFSPKLAAFLFGRHFNRTYGLRRFFLFPWLYRNRKVTVYGIFDSDDSAIELANNFRMAIAKNTLFHKHYAELLPVNSNINDKTPRILKIDEKLRIKQEKEQRELEELEKTMSKDEFNELKEKRWREKCFQAKKRLQVINNYRVFVTYQEADIDIAHNFSGQSLHIINTLSQYDMVSSEFVINNPIVNFLPMNEHDEIVLDESNDNAFHVSFLGFGSINRPIFDKMTHAYQLWDDYGHKIHYHIYDFQASDIVGSLQNEYLEKPERKGLNEEIPGDYFQKPQLYEIDAQCHGEDLMRYETLDRHFKELKAKDDGTRFNPNGFELFIISARSSNADIQIAQSLRHILLKHFDEKRLKKTFIFVRIGSEAIANSIMNEGDNKFFFSQERFNVAKANSYVAPIIIFGQNTNMADFIDRDYETLIKLGKTASGAYNPDKTQEEIELEWVRMNKTTVLSNVATTYSLKTKLAIIGCDLEVDKRSWIIKDKKDPTKVFDKDSWKVKVDALEREVSFDQELQYDVPFMKLARLEHNRWLGTMYSLYHQSQMPKSEYAQPQYAASNKSKTKGRERHVCMTTNKGLRDLYFFAVEHGLSEENARKLTYTNDIAIMKGVFETVIALQQEEEKRNVRKNSKR